MPAVGETWLTEWGPAHSATPFHTPGASLHTPHTGPPSGGLSCLSCSDPPPPRENACSSTDKMSERPRAARLVLFGAK